MNPLTSIWLVHVPASPEFTDYVIHWGYLGIFIWFITIDQLSPVPEEISLITIGYLSANGFLNPVFAAIVSFISFLSIDLVYYSLSRSGHQFASRFYTKSGLLSYYSERLKTHLPQTIMILCFIPRMRLFVPIIVGSMRLSFKKFLLFDSLTLLAFSFLYVILGEFFHKSLYALLREVGAVRHLVFVAAMIILGLGILAYLKKRRRMA